MGLPRTDSTKQRMAQRSEPAPNPLPMGWGFLLFLLRNLQPSAVDCGAHRIIYSPPASGRGPWWASAYRDAGFYKLILRRRADCSRLPGDDVKRGLEIDLRGPIV